MNNLTHVHGNTYSFSKDPEHLAKMRKSAMKQQAFSDLINELYNAFQEDSIEDTNDPELTRLIACIVEESGGTMPYSVCTLCGSTDDGHYNNNGECS